MDDDLAAFHQDHHDHFEEVAGSAGTNEQPTVRVFASIFGRERIVDGVDDVFVGDAVLARSV